MTRNEKKIVIKLLKSLKERYGEYVAILFEGKRYTIVDFPLDRMKEIGVLTEEDSFSPEATIIKVTNVAGQSLLYISKEPIEFKKERVYQTTHTTDTRGQLYFFDVDLGEKEIFKSTVGLMLREGGKVTIPCDLECHLDKRPIVK